MGEIFGLKFHLSYLHPPNDFFEIPLCKKKVIFDTEFVVLCENQHISYFSAYKNHLHFGSWKKTYLLEIRDCSNDTTNSKIHNLRIYITKKIALVETALYGDKVYFEPLKRKLHNTTDTNEDVL